MKITSIQYLYIEDYKPFKIWITEHTDFDYEGELPSVHSMRMRNHILRYKHPYIYSFYIETCSKEYSMCLYDKHEDNSPNNLICNTAMNYLKKFIKEYTKVNSNHKYTAQKLMLELYAKICLFNFLESNVEYKLDYDNVSGHMTWTVITKSTGSEETMVCI